MATRLLRGVLAGAAAAALSLGLAPGSASAHVSVTATKPGADGRVALTFNVPNERDDAGTVRVDVYFPPEQPIASVRVPPHPGWTHVIKMRKLDAPVTVDGERITEAVREVDWSVELDRSAIAPGAEEDFTVDAVALPEADPIIFKALQYYSDGNIVRWIQEPQPGQTDPERPVAILDRSAKASAPAPAGGASRTDGTSDSASASAGWVIVAVPLLLVIAAGGVAIVRRRRRPG